MHGRRSGFTLIEIILSVLVVLLLVGGVMLWQRVDKLNDWAVKEQAWSKDVYKWIRENSFEHGDPNDGGDPDLVKPPAPPDEL